MNPGNMTQLVTLQQDTGSSKDAFGAPVESWGTLAQVWARVVWLGSRERFRGQRTLAAKAASVQIYYRTDITEQHRVLIGAEQFEITGIKELGDREGLDLACELVN